MYEASTEKMESGASPNPRNSAEELTGYPARRDKRVAAGTLVPGPITRRETAVCHKWHVRWCERGRKPPTQFFAIPTGFVRVAHSTPWLLYAASPYGEALKFRSLRSPDRFQFVAL